MVVIDELNNESTFDQMNLLVAILCRRGNRLSDSLASCIMLQPFNFLNLWFPTCHQLLHTCPILPTERNCARYKFVYCIVLWYRYM